MNNENINNEEEIIEGEMEDIPFNDKRRINENGERINVEVSDSIDSSESGTAAEPAKSLEVIKLENALIEISARCEAAETKLVGVQKRFEEEKAKLEQETAERRDRMKKSLEQRAEQGRVNFLNTLIPVLDNLNLAIAASEQDASFENLLGGVKGTARSFETALNSVGVKQIEALGEKFDPELHEAVEMVEVEPERDGLIVGEFSKGFTYNERLLRPSRVQVGKGS
jgi:molecular chaperone GrpE